MNRGKPDVRQLVHTPVELLGGYLAWAERARTNPGIPFGDKEIDSRMIPMKPGDLVCLLGRPGDGKSSLLAYLARAEAGRILARKAEASEAVVYVTWEQSAEELTAFFMAGKEYSISDVAWGRVDVDKLRDETVRRSRTPIWVIGHGIGRAGANVPRMTPDVVLDAIESMRDEFGVTPTLMLFDYLQLIPIQNAGERVAQVTEAPIRIKEVALRVGAPAVCGVQASRDVDRREDRIPEPADAQWASSIEQTADKLFGIWRPARSLPIGAKVPLDSGKELTVSDNLLLIRMHKQRFDKGRYTWAKHFDPAYLKLAGLETRYIDEY